MTQIGSYIGDIVHSYNMQLKLLFMFITITKMFQLIKQNTLIEQPNKLIIMAIP